MSDEFAPQDPDVHLDSLAPPFGGTGWHWNEPSRGEHFRRCSWCGSINPADLAAETAWRVEWADRKYGWPHKFYVDVENRDRDRLFVMSASSNVPTYAGDDPHPWVHVDELTDAERATALDGGYLRPRYSPVTGELQPDTFVYFRFWNRPVHHGKFYTIHLSDRALDPAVKSVIEERSGLEFTFENGRVHWRSV